MRATGSRRWLPRRTIRLRLTLLYGGLFLVAGAGLLAITYALVAGGGPESKSVFVSNPVPAGAGQLPTVPPGLGKAAPGVGTASGTVIYQQKTPLGTVVQFRAYEGKVNATFKQVSSALRSVTTQANEQIAEVRGAQLSTLLTESAIALGIMALASIGLGWMMAGRALRPVRTMSTRARGISERNLHERLSLEGPDDELKELAETFDGLLGRLESAFESQRRFVANASHELRTPITLERALVEVALADPHPTVDSLRDTCQRVLVASEQQERLIEALLTLARSQRGVESRGPVDLRAVTAEVVQAVPANGLRVDAELSDACAAGDQAMVERLVANLIENALRHNRPDGWVSAWTGVREGRPTVEVANAGPLVDDAQLSELLKPFVRAVSNGNGHGNGSGRLHDGPGLGLGLSIVQAISEAHGARLSMSAPPEGGLRVSVAFPVGDPDC
ncbi:MAG: sensor histidine kinase [Solirubrobacteraceae bacterium]